MSGDVDGNHLFKPEVPLQIGLDERSDKATASGVDVDRAVDIALHQEVIDRLDVLVLTSVSGTKDSTDTDRVLVNQVNGLLGVDNVALLGTVDISLLDVEVTGGLFPAHLNSAVHDNVRARVVLALGLALVLPALLHGQRAQHDRLGGANSRSTHGILIPDVSWAVEKAGNHVDAAILNLCGVRVLLVVDEVLAEGLGHDFLDLIFLKSEALD